MLSKKRVVSFLFLLCCGFTNVSTMEYALKKGIISLSDSNNAQPIWEKEFTPQTVKVYAKFNHIQMFDSDLECSLSNIRKLDRNLRGEEILKLIVKTVELSQFQQDELSKNICAVKILAILCNDVSKMFSSKK